MECNRGKLLLLLLFLSSYIFFFIDYPDILTTLIRWYCMDFLTLTNPCCNHIFSFYSYCKTILCVKECFLFLSFWTSTLIGAGAAIILTKKQSHQIQNWRELQLYSCLIQILTVGLLCVATRGGQLIPWVCVCVLLVCVCVTFTCQILVVILL